MVLGWLGMVMLAWAQEPVTIYYTGFEYGEGYRTDYTLVGQNGWVGWGSGGNGIVTNYFEGGGQQAYIGAFAPEEAEEYFNTWRPLELAPIHPALSLITFSVRMQIERSTEGMGQDDFRWSIYNTNGSRLFTVDFETSTLSVNYALDDGEGFRPTGYTFETGGYYDLTLALNYLRNRWTAWLNDTVVVSEVPLTTSGAALNLGDVDAVWAMRDPSRPGDNFMVFDDYWVTAESPAAYRPTLEVMGHVPNRGFTVRVHGEPGVAYAVDASADLQSWISIRTNTTSDGVFDLVDVESPLFDRQFYRARAVGP